MKILQWRISFFYFSSARPLTSRSRISQTWQHQPQRWDAPIIWPFLKLHEINTIGPRGSAYLCVPFTSANAVLQIKNSLFSTGILVPGLTLQNRKENLLENGRISYSHSKLAFAIALVRCEWEGRGARDVRPWSNFFHFHTKFSAKNLAK